MPSASSFSPLSRFFLWLVIAATVVAICVWQWPKLSIASDIFSLLPSAENREVVKQAVDRQKAKLNHKIILLASGSTPEAARDHAEKVGATLKASDLFDTVTTRINLNDQQGLYEKLLKYRYLLITPDDFQALEKTPKDYVQKSLQVIYSPLGLERLATLKIDPLHTFADYLGELTPSHFRLVDEVPVVEDIESKTFYALISTDAASKTAGMGYYSTLLKTYKTLKHDAEKNHQEILVAGLPLYTAFGAQSAESEVSTVGTVSILAIVVLVILYFHSIKPLTMTLMSISFGVFCGFTASLVMFDKVHLLTLVFGSSLIGISVDYAFHYFCSFFEKRDQTALQRLSSIFPGITLGMATSVFAFSGLYFSPFPGLQQIAVFSGAGLLGAWLTVVLVFPWGFRGKRFDHDMPLSSITEALTVAWPDTFKRRPVGFISGCAVFILMGIANNTANDDIRHFQDVPPELLAQENRIKTLLGAQTDSRFFIVQAESTEALIEKELALKSQIQQLAKDGLLASSQGLTDYYPARKQQMANYDLYKSLFSDGTITGFLNQLGMKPDEQEHIKTDFEKAERFLPLETWVNAMPENINSLWLGCEPECASIVLLKGIKNSQSVSALKDLADGKHWIWVDQVADYSALLQHYREQTGRFLIFIVVSILIGLTLIVGFKSAMHILITPITAIMITLAALGLANIPITLFNVFAILLILGISLDYAIFYHLSNGHRRSTALAVLLSLVTTLLAFGMLGLSQTTVISAFGVTLTLGVITAAIIAPLTPSRSMGK